MARDERHRAQLKASSDARTAALRRLKDAHPDEYRTYYEEEAVARGVTPASARRDARRKKLLDELARISND